jgi:hypothetical protein
MATVHNLPPTPAFRDERPDSPISEFALRVVVELPNWRLCVVGTATLIAGHLAVTARHVLEYALRTFGPAVKRGDTVEIDSFELKLYQVLPGPLIGSGELKPCGSATPTLSCCISSLIEPACPTHKLRGSSRACAL